MTLFWQHVMMSVILTNQAAMLVGNFIFLLCYFVVVVGPSTNFVPFFISWAFFKMIQNFRRYFSAGQVPRRRFVANTNSWTEFVLTVEEAQ